MLIELKDNFTRKDLLNFVMEEIEFNIFDMDKDEFNLIKIFVDYLKTFEKLEIYLPKRKQNLQTIFFGLKKHSCQILKYLLIPHDNSVAMALRELIENYIILSFLINYDAKYTKNWSFWLVNQLYLNGTLKSQEIKVEYKKWMYNFKKDYLNCEDKSKADYDSVLKNPYGWSFPKCSKNINLKHISKIENLEKAYKYFENWSTGVHGNTTIQNFNGRFSEMTFNVVAQTVIIMDDIVDLLKPFFKHQRNLLTKIFYFSFNLRKNLEKFYNKLGY